MEAAFAEDLGKGPTVREQVTSPAIEEVVAHGRAAIGLAGEQDAGLLEEFPDRANERDTRTRGSSELGIAGVNLAAGKGQHATHETQGRRSRDEIDFVRARRPGKQDAGGL